jgi:hypothetical protein
MNNNLPPNQILNQNNFKGPSIVNQSPQIPPQAFTKPLPQPIIQNQVVRQFR